MAADDKELSRVRGFGPADPDEESTIEPPKLTFLENLQLKREEHLEKINFYSIIFFSLLAIGSFFTFLFLVPFVIEPAVTTIQMDFQVAPVSCCVVSFKEESGAENCASWSSCREGCTREIFQCVKIKVAYTDAANFSCSDRSPDHQWLHEDANLYPNVKGCGYPPSLNCTVFASTYGNFNSTFPCHFSRVDSSLVITALDPAQIEKGLVVSIIVPFLCFTGAIVFLVHAYHRMKRKRLEEAEAAEAEEEAAEEVETQSVTGPELTMPSCSKPPSSYSLKSISSRINATVVKFARERRSENGSTSLMSFYDTSEADDDQRLVESETNC